MDMWRARCVETRTPGPEGGPGRRIELKSRHRALVRPYDAAAVFAVDEKPQIQALDRTAPTLPMLPTTPQRATHDYERNGTVDLFAALDIAPRHRHLRYSRQPQPRRPS